MPYSMLKAKTVDDLMLWVMDFYNNAKQDHNLLNSYSFHCTIDSTREEEPRKAKDLVLEEEHKGHNSLVLNDRLKDAQQGSSKKLNPFLDYIICNNSNTTTTKMGDYIEYNLEK